MKSKSKPLNEEPAMTLAAVLLRGSATHRSLNTRQCARLKIPAAIFSPMSNVIPFNKVKSSATGSKELKPFTTFTQLFVEHSRLALNAGMTPRTIYAQLRHTRRFLIAIGLDESADPALIADAEQSEAEIARALKLLGLVKPESSALLLSFSVRRVRETYMLRHAGGTDRARGKK